MALSERHRRWGWDCPAVDLDFIFLEYDRGVPTAIIEYKHQLAKPQYPSHPTYQAIITLGNLANTPVFAVRYADDFSWWKVIPLNDCAKGILPDRKQMSEEEYVTFLYKIRGYDPPIQMFKNWNDVI